MFPDQLACAENLNGRRDIPEHPLVEQAIGDCLNEVMDIDAFERLLRAMRNGEITLVERDLTEPSPLALQVLNANPYAFLDDAPLEERRTQAVQSRRWLDPTTVTDLSALDAAAIERVRMEVWPAAQSEDELHEAILMLGFVADDEIATLFSDRIAGEGDLFGGVAEPWLARLEDDGRLVRVTAPKVGWVATERCDEVGAIWANAAMTRNARSHAYQPLRAPELGEALEKLVRGRLEMTGPTTVEEAARCFRRFPSRRPRRRCLRSRVQASLCAGVTGQVSTPTNGAIAACCRAYIATPWIACAAKSKRFLVLNSCAFYASGNTSPYRLRSSAPKAYSRSFASFPDSKRRRAPGKHVFYRRVYAAIKVSYWIS